MSTPSASSRSVGPAIIALSVLVGGGCRTGPEVRSFHYRTDLKPAAYFPLAEGTVWSYKASINGGPSDMLIISKVTARRGSLSTFSEQLAYDDQGDALVRLPSNTPALKAPITAGATWTIPDGAAKIVAIDGVVDAPGGRFQDCVIVEELTTDRKRITSYAPAIGPVREEIYARDATGEALFSRTLLQSYNPAPPPAAEAP